MTEHAAPPPLDELLARRDWVRRFARTLAHDDATADDLAQDTMLAAIEHPPREAAAPAGWLRRVLLRRAMNRARGERRRDEREALRAMPPASPSPADVVSTAESHRRVVEAVLALEEPYKTTVLLRFFEDLPPREVAARMGVPVETVRARVRRAVERLRERLDEEHGGRRAVWLAPLLADGRGVPHAPASVATWVVGSTVAAAVVVALVLHLSSPDGTDRSAGDSVAAPVNTASIASGVASPEASAQDGDRARTIRRRSHEATSTAPVAPPEAPPKWRPFEVRVVDSAGAPVEGVEVRVRRDGDGSWTARTGGDGRAQVSIPTAASVRKVEISDPAAAGGPVSPVKSETRGDSASTVVVERLAWVAGRVDGPDGAPVADAIVRWQGLGQREAPTDERGAFALVVPRDTTGTLLLTGRRRVGGVEPGDEMVGEVADVAAGRTDVVLVAHRAGRDQRLVVQCVTGNGSPLEGVVVGLVTTMRNDTRVRCTTDKDGRAVFEHLPDWRHFAYVHLDESASCPWERDGWATPPGFTLVRPGGDELVLRFVAGRWVRGRVLDDKGRAVPGSPVHLELPDDRRVFVETAADGSFAALLPADVGGTIRMRATAPMFSFETEGDFKARFARATPEEIALMDLRPAERDGVRPGDEGIELRLRAADPAGR
jgi:RNA polymerase sigma-70 factor (ECF subfamily)